MSSSSSGERESATETGGQLRLSAEHVAALFPFHIVFTRDLRVTQTGVSLRKVCPALVAGAELTAEFEMERPRRPFTRTELEAGMGGLFLFRHRATNLWLRGQMVPSGTDGELAFLCSPWLPKPGMLRELELGLGDFAIHDTTPEFVQVVQSQHMAIEDLRRVVEKVERQKLELRDALTTIREGEKQRRLLSMIAARTANAVVVTDAEGRIEWVNDSFTRSTGYALEEAAGKKPGEFLQGPKTDPAVVAYMRQRMASGEGFQCQVANYTKDGRLFWGAMEVQPIRGDDGVVTNFIGIQVDITEQIEWMTRSQLAYAVTRILAERVDTEEAVAAILRTICERIDAVYGGLWRIDAGQDRIRLTNWWADASGCSAEFVEQSEKMPLAKGEALPGTVWAGGAVMTVPQLSKCDVFHRNEMAMQSGMVSGFAFPVWISGEVRAVMEFFFREEFAPSVGMLETMETLGNQIGQFVERRESAADRNRVLALLESTLESAPDGVLVTDSEGRAVNYNAHWRELFRIDEPLPANQWKEVVEGLCVPVPDPSMIWAFAQGDDEATHRGILHLADGRTIEVLSNPHYQGGHIVGRVWTFRDLSAVMEGQRDRERLLANLNATLEATDNGIVVTSLQRDLLVFNQRFLDMWRLPRGIDESQRLPEWRPIVQEQLMDGPQFAARVEWLYAHPTETVQDVMHFRDGRVYAFYTQPQRVGDEIIGRVWSYRDITASWIGNQALRESEERYRVVAETAADAIVTFNEAGIIQFANRAAGRCFEYDSDSLVGRELKSLMPVARRDGYFRSIQEFASSAKSYSPWRAVEITGLRSDGTEFPVELTIGSSKSTHRRVLTAIMRDISERKAIEEQLRQATRAAEAANRAKTDFLANISHEIRTPLNAIVGLTELLRTTPAELEEMRDSIDSIWVSAESLAALINDLLDISRIEAGHVTIDNQEFDPAEVGERAIEVLRTRAVAKSLSVYFLVQPAGAPWVQGDPNRVRQILINLLSNAIKFTEKGSVTLELAWREDPAGGVRLEYAVEDTGIGISDEDRERVFDSFYRADTPEAAKAGGVGLGLSISRALAERMGGRLVVEQAPGGGSRFTLGLPPLARVEKEGAALVKGRLSLIGAPERVELQAAAIRSAGLDVVCVTDPQEAKRLLRSGADADFLCVDAGLVDDPAYAGVFTDEATVPVFWVGKAAVRQAKGGENVFSCPLTPDRIRRAIAAVGAAARPPARSVAKESAAAPASTGGGRILLVEDNPAGQLYLNKLLTRAGFAVTLASSGAEALAKSGGQEFDLILMDILLPDGSGLDVIRRIRERGGVRVPILSLTAHAVANYRAEAFAAGADDYITKPVRPAELVDVVNRWMRKEYRVLVAGGTWTECQAVAAMLPAGRGYEVRTVDARTASVDGNWRADALVLYTEAPGGDFAAMVEAVMAAYPDCPRLTFGSNYQAAELGKLVAGPDDTVVPLPRTPEELQRLVRRAQAGARPTAPAAVATSEALAGEIAAMASGYLRRMQASISESTEKLGNGQTAAIARFGHDLKGSGAAYGFPVITELGRRLEEAAKESRDAEAEKLLRELAAYVGQALEAYPAAEVKAAGAGA